MKHFTRPIERLGHALRAKAATPDQHTPHGLGLWWTFGAGLAAAAAVIVGIVQNSQQVKLHYLVWHATVSLIAVLLTTALIAVFLAEVGGLVWRRRRRSKIGRRSELETFRSRQQPTDETMSAAVPASPS